MKPVISPSQKQQIIAQHELKKQQKSIVEFILTLAILAILIFGAYILWKIFLNNL